MDGAPGFFGKLPQRGDFLRRLPASFTSRWDEWLQAGLSASMAGLESGEWLDCYLTGPIWRFSLSADLIDGVVHVGVMMPSVDAANRHFPLTVAAPVTTPVDPFRVALGAGGWCERVEAIMLGALKEEISLETFEAELGALGPVQLDGANCRLLDWSESAAADRIVRIAQTTGIADLAPILGELLHREALAELGAYSLWWTRGSDRTDPQLLQCQGLPAADRFTYLLDPPHEELEPPQEALETSTADETGQEPPMEPAQGSDGA